MERTYFRDKKEVINRKEDVKVVMRRLRPNFNRMSRVLSKRT